MSSSRTISHGDKAVIEATSVMAKEAATCHARDAE
jgi:hypothetical protein